MSLNALLVTMLLAGALPALAQLQGGDVAIVAVNTSGADEFAWVALRGIPANTAIRFTDSSVSNGWFRWTEHLGDSVAKPGPLQWLCTNALRAGTVVRWQCGAVTNWSIGQTSGGRMDLSSDGDQIIAYLGDITNSGPPDSSWRGDPQHATMLFAMDFANNGWGLLTNQPTATSMVPPGLSTDACTAVYVTRKDNGFYSGMRTGTAMQLRRAVSEPANWTVGSAEFSAMQWVASFCVTQSDCGTVFTLQ
jgi:hypothetical protein